jgi:DNA topoisomerase-6 subunit B
VVLLVHMASVWVPFTSESKDSIAHYPEILREAAFALQELGRLLGVHLSRRDRLAEQERKQRYIELYLPHLALGLRQILDLSETEETRLRDRLRDMLERSRTDS